MATIPYTIVESTLNGRHSISTRAKSYSTLDFDDLAEEVVESVGIAPSVVKTVLDRYMTVAKRQVLRGHRVKFGDLLTVYPQMSCSVKDEVDEEGNILKVATPDMLNIAKAKGSIGATISQSVQQSFAASVSWKRDNSKDEKDEENTTDPTDTTDPDDGGTTGSTDPDTTNPDTTDPDDDGEDGEGGGSAGGND